jgi:hypothetical protein
MGKTFTQGCSNLGLKFANAFGAYCCCAFIAKLYDELNRHYFYNRYLQSAPEAGSK